MKIVAVAVLLVLTLMGRPAMAVEEPTYTTVLHANDFELRDYPSLVVAEVTVTGDRGAAASKGFRLLAGYIFGGNVGHRSVAMTAPVVETPSQTIAMTAPVLQTEAEGGWIVRFTMPRQYTLDTLPVPKNPAVHLHATAPVRVAVVRFSGLISAALVQRKTEALEAFIKTRRLHAIGPASLAQYDPPWTLWFMRRNEIMIPVEVAP